MKRISFTCMISMLITVISFLTVYRVSEAQMRIEYPRKFRLTGIIELRYNDFYSETTVRGNKSDSSFSVFGQYYRLGAEGYIYHPRLATFSAGISFSDTRPIRSGKGRSSINSENLGYDLHATFLPYRPFTLDIYALRNTYTINFLHFPSEETTMNRFGAILKIRKRKLPTIRMEFEHESIDSTDIQGGSRNSESNRYSLDIRGRSSYLATIYFWNFQLIDFSTENFSYTSKHINLSHRTKLKKETFLFTNFNFSEHYYYKLTNFNAQLTFPTGERFNHSYFYNFSQSTYTFTGLKSQGIEGETTKDTVHSGTGSFSYKFSDRLRYSLSLKYGLHSDEFDKWNFSGLNTSLSYGRLLAGFNFASYLRFLYTKDDRRGDLYEGSFEIDALTRKLRLGLLYANYMLTLSKEETKLYRRNSEEIFFDDTELLEEGEIKTDTQIHSFRVGIRGRGLEKRFSRAQWNVENEFFYSKSTIKRDKRVSEFDDDFFDEPTTETIHREIKRITFRGNISYPFGWANFYFNSSYSFGESNSRKSQRFFHEERITYPYRKNLNFLISWKELWEKFDRSSLEKTNELQLLADYRIGKIKDY